MKEREQWKNRSVFIMAAVGSAIGLGNIWRFPYIAAQNGGGAFLVPYFIALLTAGIPLMIIEYGLGIRSQGSANIALGAIKKPLRFIGWFAILSAFAINIYYCMVLGWTWNFLFHMGDLSLWASDISSSKDHFFNSVLHISSGPWDFVQIHYQLLFWLLVTWVIIWAIIKGGLSVVGKVLLYTVPLPIILVLILLVRGLTLDGATTGLNYYLSPDWIQLKNPQVWLAAYGQIFFSLSVGFGTMIAYSSFMPRDTELPNSAAITSFSNCCFSFLAGLAVFSVLGYFAVATNSTMEDISQAGPGLAFVVYPAALAKLPIWVKFFGFLFFITLLFLGVDSAFSLLETVGAALSDKFDLPRVHSTTIVAVISFVLGIPLATSAGLYWLDIIDHFIMSYAITFVAIMECIAVGWILGTKKFTREVNKNAEIKIGPIFSIMVKFITPIILTYTIIKSFLIEIESPYEGYPVSALIILGLGTLLLISLCSFILSTVKTKNDKERELAVKNIYQEVG
ncbi:MAG: sodium-dependent transporter [Deltaproteobacteria bacterium]|nr:sodium-dependent transporter [Deltaproteobacteria bacterium]MBW1915917.1 sodium-dependent transporter [Deltaproteobacteria bacterium]